MEFSGALTLRANACATITSKNGVATRVSKNGAVSRIGAGEITKLDMRLKKTSLGGDVKRGRPGATSFVVTSSLETQTHTQTMVNFILLFTLFELSLIN